MEEIINNCRNACLPGWMRGYAHPESAKARSAGKHRNSWQNQTDAANAPFLLKTKGSYDAVQNLEAPGASRGLGPRFTGSVSMGCPLSPPLAPPCCCSAYSAESKYCLEPARWRHIHKESQRSVEQHSVGDGGWLRQGPHRLEVWGWRT